MTERQQETMGRPGGNKAQEMSLMSFGPRMDFFFLSHSFSFPVHFYLLVIFISYLYSNNDRTAEGQQKEKPTTSTHHNCCEPLLAR